MAGNLNSGMCSPLCSDVCAFYLPQGLTIYIYRERERERERDLILKKALFTNTQRLFTKDLKTKHTARTHYENQNTIGL